MQFQVAALADVLCDDQAHAPARINQFVRNHFHFKVFPSLP